ncbi:MAG: peptidoglycan DD-metalloendopeptidase family protein [Alistipes sp.]|nr:peptidoglycan DD-metalloendopeptidase family protein [Alistipes sp.]
MMRLFRYILTLTLLFIFVATSAQTSKIEQQKRVIANLERSIAREERQLAQLKKNKASTEKQVRALTKQIEKRNTLIRETTRQINQLSAEVAASERRLMDLGGQLSSLEKNTHELVRAAYRNYRYHNALTYLFASTSFSDIARRIAMLRVATEYRIAQMKRVAEVRKDVQAERETLAKRKDELSATKRRLDKQRKQLRSDMASAKKAISTMSSKQQSVLRSKMEHEEKLNSAIKQLRKLTKGNKAGASFSQSTTALNLPVVGGKVKRYKGNMAEVVGKEGAAVTSIYEGKVMDIKRNKLNNKYDIYIAHGEYITSYANLSAVTVAKGAVVKRGQRIGTIGSAVNISTMEMEYKIVFGIYAPTPDIKMSAANCFKK